MRIIKIFTLLFCYLFFSVPAYADQATDIKLYVEVMGGTRSVSTLSAIEKKRLIAIHQLFNWKLCSSGKLKCRMLCSASNSLKSASDALSRCAATSSRAGDCDYQFRNVEAAFEEYKSASDDLEDDEGENTCD